MRAKTGVLLIQLGTPDSPKIGDVRKYLSEFLNDPRVIDIPWVARKLLVNLIIVPFRSPKSAKIYQKVWTKEGSPLLIHSNNLKRKLQDALGEEYCVELAMRYQNPSLESVLERMREKHFNKIIIIPLFPHYASASTGSALEKAMRIISKWYVIPDTNIVSQYFSDSGFIEAVAEQARQYEIDSFDHVVFSYHGLPIRQVDKVYDDGNSCKEHRCEEGITEANHDCYAAECYETSRLIAEKLNIEKKKYSVSFQSRLDKDWLEPFTDKVLIELANRGKKECSYLALLLRRIVWKL